MAERTPGETDPATAKQERAGCSLLPLVADGIGFVVDGARLLDDVSLSLEDDDRTVVLGPNGAGKSLLLRLVHGLLEPSTGSIRWNGVDAAEASRRQAMVFQRPVLLRRSAAANIAHALKTHRVPRARQAELIERALDLAGLTHLGQRSARALSGGEQQRLSIARVAVLQPDVLLLDEPTSSLDPAAARAVEQMILDIDRRGTKIIMTTHDIGQARRLAEEVVFLHRGRLLEASKAEPFFEGPQDREAARFLAGKLLD